MGNKLGSRFKPNAFGLDLERAILQRPIKVGDPSGGDSLGLSIFLKGDHERFQIHPTLGVKNDAEFVGGLS
ncbi:MAG: hypothetical protein H6751_05175 [Candidatus Omnitrophica bacterium]|nr:hypothetical protein [Candidatus Omnitrophota bacterium]